MRASDCNLGTGAGVFLFGRADGQVLVTASFRVDNTMSKNRKKSFIE